YLRPKELRDFRARLKALRKDSVEGYKDATTPLQRQLDEVMDRLALYESIRGYAKPPDDMPAMPGYGKPEREKPADPFAFVALDAVPGSPWFSMADLRMIVNDPESWHELFMTERVKKGPQLYMKTEHAKALAGFQEMDKTRKGQ